MKHIFFSLIAMLFIQTQFVHAGTIVSCNQAYGQAVSTCAHDLSSLSPNMRAGAQKACVADAKRIKDSCLSGQNTCLDTCQANYNDNVNQCNLNYDASACGTDIACQAFIQAQNSACVSASVDVLNACNASCPAL